MAQINELISSQDREERRQNRRWLILLRAAQADKNGFERTLEVMGNV